VDPPSLQTGIPAFGYTGWQSRFLGLSADARVRAPYWQGHTQMVLFDARPSLSVTMT
jgi:hypothetical protein